jgi:hypothetical protein
MISRRIRRGWGVVPLAAAPLVLVVACSQSVSIGADAPTQGGDARGSDIKHEPCDLDSKSAVRVDVNNDGKGEIVRVMAGARELCRAVDLNFDGRWDSYLYFDDRGKLRRRESDFDRDGVVDEIATYQDGKIVRKDRETNLDGKLDTWDFYTNEKLVKRERDTNADGRVDQWWQFPDADKPECPIIMTDTDGDGRPDARLDVCKEREAQAAAQAAPAAAPAGSVAAPAASASAPPAATVAKPPEPAADAGAPAKPDAGGKKK